MSSNAVTLKASVGVGGLSAMTVWLDFLHPAKVTNPSISLWLWISLPFVPFLVFWFIRYDELSNRFVRVSHIAAVVWYAVMLAATIGLMAYRGFKGVDLLFVFFMILGLWPCYKAVSTRLEISGIIPSPQ